MHSNGRRVGTAVQLQAVPALCRADEARALAAHPALLLPVPLNWLPRALATHDALRDTAEQRQEGGGLVLTQFS